MGRGTPLAVKRVEREDRAPGAESRMQRRRQYVAEMFSTARSRFFTKRMKYPIALEQMKLVRSKLGYVGVNEVSSN